MLYQLSYSRTTNGCANYRQRLLHRKRDNQADAKICRGLTEPRSVRSPRRPSDGAERNERQGTQAKKSYSRISAAPQWKPAPSPTKHTRLPG